MSEEPGKMTLRDAIEATRSVLSEITLPSMPAAMCAVMAQAVTVPISCALANLEQILEAMDSWEKAGTAEAPAKEPGKGE